VTFFGQPRLLDTVLGWARTFVPPQSMQQITSVLHESFAGGSPGLISLGAAGAVWAASGGIRSAMNALNRAYDVTDARVWWRRYLVSQAYTVGLGVLIKLAAAVVLVIPRMGAWALEQGGLGTASLSWWRWLRYPLAITLLTLATGMAYSLLPNVRGIRWISPGAGLAVVMWIGLSLGFRLYISNFGRYNVLYGSLGAVIVLLLYLWLCSVVLLLGGEFNAAVQSSSRQHELSK
jgi:membrane protein